jgi:hypothetical protein
VPAGDVKTDGTIGTGHGPHANTTVEPFFWSALTLEDADGALQNTGFGVQPWKCLLGSIAVALLTLVCFRLDVRAGIVGLAGATPAQPSGAVPPSIAKVARVIFLAADFRRDRTTTRSLVRSANIAPH